MKETTFQNRLYFKVDNRQYFHMKNSLSMLSFKNFNNTKQFRVIQTYVVNFICQKLQNFWADSDSLGKINDKKISKFFFSMFSFA